MTRQPFCSRCGDTRRLFELAPGVWACRWQAGCDHRILVAEARRERLVRSMELLERQDWMDRFR